MGQLPVLETLTLLEALQLVGHRLWGGAEVLSYLPHAMPFSPA